MAALVAMPLGLVGNPDEIAAGVLQGPGVVIDEQDLGFAIAFGVEHLDVNGVAAAEPNGALGQGDEGLEGSVP